MSKRYAVNTDIVDMDFVNMDIVNLDITNNENKKRCKSDSMNEFLIIQRKTHIDKYCWRHCILMKLYFMLNMNKYYLKRREMDNYLRRYIGRLIYNSNFILDTIVSLVLLLLFIFKSMINSFKPSFFLIL